MNQNLTIPADHLQKLLLAANPDAALLYLYLAAGNDMALADRQLHLTGSRLSCATAALRQLGLWQDDRRQPLPLGEAPRYTEEDVIRAVDKDDSFRSLYGDVISLLVCYCKERARQKGSSRNPSLRTIEKEAYAWAEQGIDTMEEAVAYIQNQNHRRSRLGRLMGILQIRGRNLTAGEERYAQQWLDWGFQEEAIALAYERTCLNTGSLNWAYMNKILSRWQEAGLLTLEQIQTRDKKPVKGATGQLGQAELEAIQKVLQEG